jgi:non-reducing end alpha-L-arabinofuranosidase
MACDKTLPNLSDWVLMVVGPCGDGPRYPDCLTLSEGKIPQLATESRPECHCARKLHFSRPGQAEEAALFAKEPMETAIRKPNRRTRVHYFPPIRRIDLVGACSVGMLAFGCSGSDTSSAGSTGASGGSLGTSNHSATSIIAGSVSANGSSQPTGGATSSVARTATSAGGASTLGGTTSAGGTASSGGATSAGGRSSATSGAKVGGAPTAGGSRATGGAKPTGGSASNTGGANASGANNVGGKFSMGGAVAAAGRPTSGGAEASGGTNAAAGRIGAGGTSDSSSSTPASAGAGTTVTGPCDIYESGKTPCVAAHSTVRALYGAYSGKLYQVQRKSDQAIKDITALAPGGFADSAAQETFCSGTTCTISIIYDQSPKGNDLKPAPGGGAAKTADSPVTANKLKLTVGGHTVYGAFFEGGQGYRNNSKTTGLAKNDEPESLYMVASGKHYNDKCCWDYGNAETTNNDDGEGTMEAIYFGNCGWWGKGSGSGPWIMADIENGLWAGNVTPNNNNTPVNAEYITAMVKGKSHTLAIKGGDATTGALKTFWEGAYPAKGATGKAYDPMQKQGAIILGIGGDNSNGATGTFFEGCITTGYSSDTVDEAIQANIIAAGYGK